MGKTSWKIDTHGDFWFASWSYLLVCWQTAPWLVDGRIDIDFLMKCSKLITELTCMIMNPIFPWLGLHSDDNFNITLAVVLCSFWIRICWSWCHGDHGDVIDSLKVDWTWKIQTTVENIDGDIRENICGFSTCIYWPCCHGNHGDVIDSLKVNWVWEIQTTNTNHWWRYL